MAQNSQTIQITGGTNTTTQIQNNGEAMVWKPVNNIPLSKTDASVQNNGEKVILDATEKTISAGTKYIQAYGSGRLKQTSNVLSLVGMNTYSCDMVMSPTTRGAGKPVIGGTTYNSYSVNMSGTAYLSDSYKVVFIEGGYNENPNGSKDSKLNLKVHVGTSDILVLGTGLGIIEPNIDSFSLLVEESKDCQFSVVIYMCKDTSDANTLVNLYGAFSQLQNTAETLGDAKVVTASDTSDSGVFFPNEVYKDTDIALLFNYDAYQGNAYGQKGGAIDSTGYACFNTGNDEIHASAFAQAISKYKPVGTNTVNYEWKYEVPADSTLEGIVGTQFGVFEATTSTTNTEIASLVLSQYKKNGDPTTGDVLDLTKSCILANIIWKDPKNPLDLKLYRDLNSNNADVIRFNFVSNTYTPEQILSPTSTDELYNQIKSIEVVCLKPNATSPSPIYSALVMLDAFTMRIDVTKSTSTTSAPIINIVAVSGSFGTYNPTFISVDPATDYTSVKGISARIRIDGLYSGQVVAIHSATPYKVGLPNQDMGYAGIVGDNDQSPIFTAIGGGLDVRGFTLPNETKGYTFCVTMYSVASSITGADAIFVYSDNDTNNDFTINATPDNTTSDKLADLEALIPNPINSLPVIQSCYQEFTTTDITDLKVGCGATTQADNGWSPNKSKEIYKPWIDATGTIKANSLSFMWFADNRPNAKTYYTRTPLSPTVDPYNNYTVTWNDALTSWFVTAIGQDPGYFNRVQLLATVVSSSSYEVVARIDVDTIDVNNNTCYVKFFRLDGGALDTGTIAEAGFSILNVIQTPFADTDLFSVGSTSIIVSVQPNGTNVPVVTNVQQIEGNGIQAIYDSGTPLTLWNGNTAGQPLSKYRMRLKITGAKSREDCLYFVATSPSINPADNTTLSSDYWSIGLVPGTSAPIIEVVSTGTGDITLDVLISNIEQRTAFTINKVKTRAQLLPNDIVSDRILSLGYWGIGATPVVYGDYIPSTTTGTHITGISKVAYFIKSYSINQSTIGGQNRAVPVDILTSDDNLGYKNGGTAIYTNNRTDGTNIYLDTSGFYLSVDPGYIEILNQASTYSTSYGKKSVITVNNKVINLLPNGNVSNPLVSAQMWLKPLSELSVGTSTLLTSSLNLENSTNTDIKIDVSTSVAQASTVVKGFSVLSVQINDYELLNRPTRINVSGFPRILMFRLNYTQPTGATDNHTATITLVSPTDVNDASFNLALGTTIGIVQPDTTDPTNEFKFTSTTDYTANQNKLIGLRLTVTPKAGYELDGRNFLEWNGIDRSSLNVSDGVILGLPNCSDFPNFSASPDLNNGSLWIRNVTQETIIKISMCTPEGYYVDPSTSATEISYMNSIASYSGQNATTPKQLFGNILNGSGNVLYVQDNYSLNYASKDMNLMGNKTNGTWTIAPKVYGTPAPFKNQILEIEGLVTQDKSGKLSILGNVRYAINSRTIISKPSTRTAFEYTLEYMYEKEVVEKAINDLIKAHECINNYAVKLQPKVNSIDCVINELKNKKMDFDVIIDAINNKKLYQSQYKQAIDKLNRIEKELNHLYSIKFNDEGIGVMVMAQSSASDVNIKAYRLEERLKSTINKIHSAKVRKAMGQSIIKNVLRKNAIMREAYAGTYLRHPSDSEFSDNYIKSIRTSPDIEKTTQRLDALMEKHPDLYNKITCLYNIKDRIACIDAIENETEGYAEFVEKKFKNEGFREALRTAIEYLAKAKVCHSGMFKTLISSYEGAVKDHHVMFEDLETCSRYITHVLADKLVNIYKEDALLSHLRRIYDTTNYQGSHLIFQLIIEVVVKLSNIRNSNPLKDQYDIIGDVKGEYNNMHPLTTEILRELFGTINDNKLINIYKLMYELSIKETNNLICKGGDACNCRNDIEKTKTICVNGMKTMSSIYKKNTQDKKNGQLDIYHFMLMKFIPVYHENVQVKTGFDFKDLIERLRNIAER